MRIVIAANSVWNLVNFRLGVIRALVAAGHEVHTLAPPDPLLEPQLWRLGVSCHPLTLDAHGTQPRRELVTLLHFLWWLRLIRPQAAMFYTLKPVIYGGIAARLLGIPRFSHLTGLGRTATWRGVAGWGIRRLQGLALRHAERIYVQHEADAYWVRQQRWVPEERLKILPGSGVDVEHFSLAAVKAAPRRVGEDGLQLLWVGRLLKSKGVETYVTLVGLLRRRGFAVHAQILGLPGLDDPDAITVAQLQEWQVREGIEVLPSTLDVRPWLAAADVVVLPTRYPEGVPRTLLEAAAMERIVIAADQPGCQAVIQQGVTGFLCPVDDLNTWLQALAICYRLTPAERRAMGARARAWVQAHFRTELVCHQLLEDLESLGAVAPAWFTP